MIKLKSAFHFYPLKAFVNHQLKSTNVNREVIEYASFKLISRSLNKSVNNRFHIFRKISAKTSIIVISITNKNSDLNNEDSKNKSIKTVFDSECGS